MKKYFIEVVFYVLSVVLQIISVIIAYSFGIFIFPLIVGAVVPFYLLIGSIIFSIKQNYAIVVWRLIPSFLSLNICYKFIMSFITDYHLNQGIAPELRIINLVRDYYIVSLIILTVVIVLYQTVHLIRLKRSFYNGSKERKQNDDDV